MNFNSPNHGGTYCSKYMTTQHLFLLG